MLEEKSHCVGTDAEVGSMTEGKQPAIPEEHAVAHCEEREKGNLDQHIEVDNRKNLGHQRDKAQTHNDYESVQDRFPQSFSPKRPVGRTISTTAIKIN
jgi:hypothetical protein